MNRSPRILPSEITAESIYLNRRRVLTAALAGAAVSAFPKAEAAAPPPDSRFNAPRNAPLSITDPPNSWEDVTTYNNFYEFGTDKSDPAINAKNFK
ncbi:MAG: mononuclear molybdenum enzyme YedY, partial [Pseudomonadales bacterium]|nr:mononuclear molybdenum enzyme YedY [Pseudomonadales bacterium]